MKGHSGFTLLIAVSASILAGPRSVVAKPLRVCEVILAERFDRQVVTLRGVLGRPGGEGEFFTAIGDQAPCNLPEGKIDFVSLITPDSASELPRVIAWMRTADRLASTTAGRERGVCATVEGTFGAQTEPVPGMPRPHHGTGPLLLVHSIRDIRVCNRAAQ